MKVTPETLTDEMVRQALVEFAADCLKALHAEAYLPRRRICEYLNARAVRP